MKMDKMKQGILACIVLTCSIKCMEKNLAKQPFPIEYVQGYAATIKRLIAQEEGKTDYAGLERAIESKKAELQRLRDSFDQTNATVYDKLDHLQSVNEIGREITVLQKKYLLWRSEISVLKHMLLETLKKQNSQTRRRVKKNN